MTTMNSSVMDDYMYEDVDTVDSLHCPEYSEADAAAVAFFSFWVEGVANVVIASFGLIANALSGYILTR